MPAEVAVLDALLPEIRLRSARVVPPIRLLLLVPAM